MEEYSGETKRTLFFGILNFINKLMPKRLKKAEKTQFDKYLKSLDKKDPMYDRAQKTSELCNEAVTVAKQRIFLIRKIHEIDEQMAELSAYDKLTEEDVVYLKKLMDRFSSLSKDKSNLIYQMTSFDKSLENMHYMVDDAKYIVDYIPEAERNQKILKKDISLLQGEKAELEFEYNQMINAHTFIYRSSIGLVILFGFILLFLSYLFLFKNVSIFLPAASLSFFLIIIITLVYIFRKRIKAELKINRLKYDKIIGIINKKTAVYAHYTNFLNYVYKKYNVRSSEKLKKNIADFNKYKTMANRFDKLKNSMYETEKEISAFLREKKLGNTVITVEGLAKTLNIDDKRRTYGNYEKEKKRLEERLSQLDEIHESIWNNLVILHDEDKTEDEIIGSIIEAYIEEVGNIANISLDDFSKGYKNDMEESDMSKLFKKIAEINNSIEKEKKPEEQTEAIKP